MFNSTENKKKATLYVYKGCNGLPSIDAKCLQILYLLRLTPNNNIRIRTSGFSTSPILPLLAYDGTNITAQDHILKSITKLVGDHCDSKHESRTKSKIVAYKNLTFNVMDVVYNLNVWGFEENYNHFIKLYGKQKYFPFRMIYVRRMRTYTQNILLDMCGAISLRDHLTVRQDIVEDFFEALTTLLNENEYLSSNTPTSLDAYVCGYLAPILLLKFPLPHLQNILKRYDTLCSYVRKFNDKYGDKDTYVLEEEPPQPDNDRASVGLMVGAGFIAVATMIIYGLINDIIKIK